MSSSSVYLLCGVPASGKTWVVNHLHQEFQYIPHDLHSHESLVDLALKSAQTSPKPILIDCPFNERALRSALEEKNLRVIPIFIIESPEIISHRYFKREGRRAGKNIITRAQSILSKVREWNAYSGTSEEVLGYLKSTHSQEHQPYP